MSSVLVLDDRPVERELLMTVLGYSGHTVVQASTGDEALALARETRPDLVIVDFLMPGMNGPEFVRELRADQALRDTRVVFCTANCDEVELAKLAETLGVSHILAKPCEPEEIIDVVNDALGVSTVAASPKLSEEFGPEQLRVLNAKLVQKVSQLEAANVEQTRLHEQLRQAERQTAESLTLLQTLQSSAPVGFGFVDRDFRILQMNEPLAAALGLPLEQQLGRTVAEVAPDVWPDVAPIYRQVLDSGEPVVNVEKQRVYASAPDDTRHMLASYYPVWLSGEVIGIGLVVIDVTALRQSDDLRSVVMENIAEGLYVTDVHGRLVFMNPAGLKMLGRGEQELRGKSVHAAFHHHGADGSRLGEDECRLTGVLVDGQSVRITDDVFTRGDGSILRIAGSAAPLLSGTTVRGSVVVFRDTTEEHTEEMRVQHELDELSWVGRLRDAFDEERLVLYSQPIVPLTEQAASQPRVAGENGGPRGRDHSAWAFSPRRREVRTDPRSSTIGSSAKQHVSRQPDCVSTQTCQRRRSEHPTCSTGSSWHLVRPAPIRPAIVFEITETALMKDLAAGEAFARGITEMGCALALDDFGTGYGSLTYLQKLPIAFLKIDIAFVRGLPTNATNQHLVRAIVNIAQGFGQQTIAEGVEDAATLDLLREYGVDLAQGYHLGRPQPLALD